MRHQDVRLSARLLILEISLSFLADVPDVMAAAAQPDLPKYIPKNLLKLAVLRFRRVILRQSVRFSAFSEEKK